MLKKCDGQTNAWTDGRMDEQTGLCIELRYAQLINKPCRQQSPSQLGQCPNGCVCRGRECCQDTSRQTKITQTSLEVV